MIEIPFDIARACSEILERVLTPQVSFAYRLLTSIPYLPYNIVPSRIRSRYLSLKTLDCDLSRHLTTEYARRMLREAFALAGFALERRYPPQFLVTHDVDTVKGLDRAPLLKSVDDSFELPCIWFVPSDEYPISTSKSQCLRSSTIGSHDTKHNGKLVHMRDESLIARLITSKEKLKVIFDREITSFRSPLLQFNKRILNGLGKAGYSYDFSVPTWEPVYPSSMSGFGIEGVQRFELNGVIETPLTLFQDHQLLEVMGLSTRQAVKYWIEQAKLIKTFDGDIVLSVHPDYSFSHDLESYSTLLRSLKELVSSEVSIG